VFENIIAWVKVNTFSVMAFSIFGLLFAMRPVTWLPTLLILCCAIVAIANATYRRKLGECLFGRDLRWITIAFATWFLVSLFVGLWHWGFSKNAFLENPFRIVLALGTLALSVHAAAKKTLIAGLLVASVCAALNVAYGYLIHDAYFPRISGTTNHPIHFGNFGAFVAMLLMSAAMLMPIKKMGCRLMCLLGSMLAFAAAAASQSRSSFVVLVCMAPLFFVVKTDQFHRWAVRVGSVFALTLLLLVAAFPSLQERLRLTSAVSDIHMMASHNYQSSLGSRLAMWQGAWSLFTAHPIVGIGPHKFQSEFIHQMQTGEVPRADAEYNQPHSDLLNAASTGGVLKLMAYVLLIAAPFVVFYKNYQANKFDFKARMFPFMGMQVVGAFFLTGLTNSNFDLQIYSTTYAVLVCVLAKLSTQHRVDA
jgi:O-antigen ligase